jgi:hypothetical protein
LSGANYIHFAEGYDDGVNIACGDSEVFDLLQIKTLVQSNRGD